MGNHQLVQSGKRSEAATGAYRPGGSRKTLGQSQSTLPHIDPFTVGQVAGGAAGRDQPRGTDSRGGQHPVEDTAAVLGRRAIAWAAGLSGSTLTASLYRETQWQIETLGHSDDEGPGHASPLRLGS